MNGSAGAGAVGPFGLSGENVNPHCVEDLSIAGHGNMSVVDVRGAFSLPPILAMFSEMALTPDNAKSVKP
jgi:hypothetical protein